MYHLISTKMDVTVRRSGREFETALTFFCLRRFIGYFARGTLSPIARAASLYPNGHKEAKTALGFLNNHAVFRIIPQLRQWRA